jgi:ribosomal protein L11 methyltransferase
MTLESAATWHQITLATDEESADILSEALSDLGALSISFEDDGDQPLFEPKPGETPIWRKTRVIALFEASVAPDGVEQTLRANFGHLRFDGWQVEQIENQAWERAWLEHFRPMAFGKRLWIVPSGYEAPSDPQAVCINLDPGLAFGTGTHPTTALCLEWLDGHSPDDKTVIDFGCGSGILAIAAVLLGARAAVAVDIDPQALLATVDNAEKNGVSGAIACCKPEAMPQTRVDVLLANILANPLIELAPRLAELVTAGGSIVLSGILREQAALVLAAYQPFFCMDEPVFAEDWSRLTGTRKPQ